jgi:hypothetical protein
MPGERHAVAEIFGKLREADVEPAEGASIAQARRSNARHVKKETT